MAANPDIFGWRAGDEHYANQRPGVPDRELDAVDKLLCVVASGWREPHGCVDVFVAEAGKFGLFDTSKSTRPA